MTAAKTPRQIMDEARATVAANLPQLCAELVQWGDTGLLHRDAMLRTIAAMFEAFDGSNEMLLAQRIVEEAALRVVAESHGSAAEKQSSASRLGGSEPVRPKNNPVKHDTLPGLLSR